MITYYMIYFTVQSVIFIQIHGKLESEWKSYEIMIINVFLLFLNLALGGGV